MSDLFASKASEETEKERPSQVLTASAVATLDDDIFGGDSDLSDLSDEEEEEDSPPPRATKADASPEPRRRYRSESSDDDGEVGEEGSGDEYNATGGRDRDDPDLSKLKFKKKKKQRERDGEANGGLVGGEPSRKKKRKDKTKNQQVEVEEILDPETLRRRDLNDRLDAIIKRPKTAGGRKKKGGNDDLDLEALNDEAIAKLRNDMFTAADSDVSENQRGSYAIHKLRMLPQVINMMQKTALGDALIENGLLEAVRRWLEPLPDRSLPAVNIQRPLFEILRTLSIETSALKSSGLGKIVYFYTKCKRVEPFIAKHANQLVSDWMRPIIRRSKAFADKDIGTADAGYRPRSRPATNGMTAGSQLQKKAMQNDVNETVARRHARIPETLTATFKVAPSSDASNRHSGMNAGHSSAAGGSVKMKNYKKKLLAGQQASRRV